MKNKSQGGKKFWLLICDEATLKKWSFFLKSKDEQYDILLNFIKKLKRKGVTVSSVIFIKKTEDG